MADEKEISRAANSFGYLEPSDHEELYGKVLSVAGELLARYREQDEIIYGSNKVNLLTKF